MYRKYKNPPILDAVCEIKFVPDNGWDLTIPGLFYERVKEEFFDKEQNTIEDVEITRKETGEIEQQVKVEQHILFRSSDRSTVIRLGPNLISVSRIKPYTGWEPWRKNIVGAYEIFTSIKRDSKISRLGLRYINKIEIPQSKIDMDEYLSFSPRFNDTQDESEFSSFISGVTIPYSDGKDQVKIVLTSDIPSKPSLLSCKLDIDYYTVGQPGAEISIPEWIDTAHERARLSFERCITDKTRALFEEE